ncbi:hypothetical protein [Shinella zoogloeoides]|uniref:hypothetical protein n=1 Tax=Shinella zoogloeoides TaxID=352475 RepID=UPI00273DCE21|nr:hypothetical protein [Shinella zoogloeoides]WLR90981.1 hypothetical protein Q9316_00095 [Shinella zoogloeoides]
MKETKFPECTGCRFFSAKFERPECRECGAGEFYEEKINTRQPSRDELMDMLQRDYDE